MPKRLEEPTVIVGGGIVGCALAYQLSKRGQAVILLEKGNIASGATGRCGGMIMKIDGRDSDPQEITKRWAYVAENDRMLDELPRELDVDFDLWRRGSLDIARTEQEVQVLRKVTTMQQDVLADPEIKFLERNQLKQLSPLLSDACLGARFRPSDGCLDPFKLTHAYARRAKELGAQIRTKTPVEEVLFCDDNAVGLRTQTGTIEAARLVNCTNGWASYLTPELPVVPLRSLAVITQAAPTMPALTFEAEIDEKVCYGCTQTRRGNILVGGPPESPGTFAQQFEETVTMRELQLSSEVITKMFPSLGYLNIIRGWAGAMGTTPDGLPCVGKLDPYKNVYVAVGYPNGMSYASVTARLLAELIIEGQSSISLETLNPNRFGGKKFEWPERYDYTILADYLGRVGQN